MQKAFTEFVDDCVYSLVLWNLLTNFWHLSAVW